MRIPKSVLSLGILEAGCPKPVTMFSEPTAQYHPEYFDSWEIPKMQQAGVPASLIDNIYEIYIAGYPVEQAKAHGIRGDDILAFRYHNRGTTRKAMATLRLCVQRMMNLVGSNFEPVYERVGAAKYCMNGFDPADDARLYADFFDGVPAQDASYIVFQFARENVDVQKATLLKQILTARDGYSYPELYGIANYARIIRLETLTTLTNGRDPSTLPLSIVDITTIANKQSPQFVQYVADIIDLGVCRDSDGYLKVGDALILWKQGTPIDNIRSALEVGVHVCHDVPSELFYKWREETLQVRNKEPAKHTKPGVMETKVKKRPLTTVDDLKSIETLADLESTVASLDESPAEPPFYPTFEYRMGVPPDHPDVVYHYRALEQVPDAMQRLVFERQKGKIVFITGPITEQPELKHLRGKKDKYGRLWGEVTGVYSPDLKKAFFRVDRIDRDVALHEVGHMVDHLIGQELYKKMLSDRTIWQNIVSACPNIATDERDQDFADWFSLYYKESRSTFEYRCPQAAHYFTLLEHTVALYMQKH